MEKNRKLSGLLFGAIICCIAICIGSFLIAHDTYYKIKYITDSIDDIPERIDPASSLYYDNNYNFYESDWSRDTWHKVRTRQASNQYAILYASSFIFSISLCCFTYICVKSFS